MLSMVVPMVDESAGEGSSPPRLLLWILRAENTADITGNHNHSLPLSFPRTHLRPPRQRTIHV